jgi:ribosome biogenesis protein YTM1
MEAMEVDGVGGGRTLNVRFVTKLPDPYKVPERPLVVPANVNRRGLSRVVNHLLNLGTHSVRRIPMILYFLH